MNYNFYLNRTMKSSNSSATVKKLKEYSFETLSKKIILVGQFFAFLPVDGVVEDKLQFKWCSYKTIYTCVTIVLQMIYLILLILFSDVNFNNFFALVVVVWNVKSLSGLILLLKLGYDWPRVIQKWNRLELSMLFYKLPKNLKLRFKIFPIGFALVGTCEHLIFVGGATQKVMSKMKTNDSFIESYFKATYSEIFDCFDYKHWRGVVIEFLSLVSTFGWQYANLLVVLLSAALAEKFKQITKALKHYEAIEIYQWAEIRRTCNLLVELSKTVTDAISGIVFVSFIGNVYFLSLYTFQTFVPKSPYEQLYFWYGFLFVFFHMIIVSIYASWVNEESLRLVLELHNIPSSKMPFEAFVVLKQMRASDICIHGYKLFKITRNIVLHVISSIVTVQLILFQFQLKINYNV